MAHRRTWFVGLRRRCWLVFALLLALVLFGGTNPSIPRPPDRSGVTQRINERAQINQAINKQVWFQIEDGMSREQVIQLIGGPSGTYNEHPIALKGQLSSWAHNIIDRYDPDIWTGENGEIIVCFDAAGIVRHSYYRPVFTCK